MKLEKKAVDFLERNKDSFSPALANIESIITKTKKIGDFILLFDNNEEVIAYLGYHIYENFIQGKYNIIFIDLMLVDENFRKNFLILNELKSKFAKIIKEKSIVQIQTQAYNKNTNLINMYSKLAYKSKPTKADNKKTTFFIKPEKFLKK